MTGFAPRISGIVSDRSTNWATTTAQKQICLLQVVRKGIRTCCYAKVITNEVIAQFLQIGVMPLLKGLF